MEKEPTMSPEENPSKAEISREENLNDAAPSAKKEADNELDSEQSTSEENPVKLEAPVNKPSLEIATEKLALDEFPAAMEKILKNDQWMKLGHLVRDIQTAFDKKFLALLQEKKEEFIASGGNEID
ncbi:MAG: hypothetical protein ACPH63_03895, partial [Flavobacteriaceae bacterium]